MRNPETMLRVYEELANRFVKQNEPRFRDHCLVLAADAALSSNRPEDAERLRQQLLQHNPHHLLRPFASMSEAMQAPDVQEYVADLRRQWPPEFVQKLYLGGPEEARPVESKPAAAPPAPPPPSTPPPLRPAPRVESVTKGMTIPARAPARPVAVPPLAAPAVARPAAPVAPPVRSPEPAKPSVAPRPAQPIGAWLATVLLYVGIAGGLGLLFIALIWPLLN